MANPDSVGQFYLDSFGYGRVGFAQAQSLATAGAAAITIPILSGGLTNSGNVTGSGSVILRRITVNNPSGTVSSAYVTISTDNLGANTIVSNVALASITGTGTYQDLTLTSNLVTGNTTQALYVNIKTASGNSNTVSFAVYGDVVQF